MKLTGLLCLLLAGILLGFRSADQIRTRVDSLRNLSFACNVISREIESGHMKPAELIHRLAAQPGHTGQFFQDVETGMHTSTNAWEAWQLAMRNGRIAFALTNEAWRELESVGRALTCFSVHAAHPSIAASAHQFRAWADQTAAAQKNEMRLRQTLWPVAALLAGILLM